MVISMGFAIFAEEEQRQEGTAEDRYRRAAVGCWFTSRGKAIPKLLKYEDDSGCLHMIRDIQVLESGERYCGGSPVREYRCRALLEEREVRFWLFYHLDTATWDLAFGENKKFS